jgi:hypothetical protein
MQPTNFINFNHIFIIDIKIIFNLIHLYYFHFNFFLIPKSYIIICNFQFIMYSLNLFFSLTLNFV